MFTEKAMEQRLRRALNREGYGLRKSRTKNIHADDLGGYMIYDLATNAVVAGARFDLDLDDVAGFVEE